MQTRRLHDRQVAVGELAKRQPGIGVTFAQLPSEQQVADFGLKVRAQQQQQQQAKLLRAHCKR